MGRFQSLRHAAAIRPPRYAAGTGDRAAMVRERSKADAPRMKSDLNKRSNDTEGSPASIFATRD